VTHKGYILGYLYIFGTVLFTVYGQLILKWRIVYYGALPELFLDKIAFLFKLVFDPFIFSGFASAFIASFFWMAAMTKFEVSYAYPIILSGLLLLTSTLGIILLNESISYSKIVGILFILTGVFIMYINTSNI
jgi:multidrug transporter EmrE-like cation transporter